MSTKMKKILSELSTAIKFFPDLSVHASLNNIAEKYNISPEILRNKFEYHNGMKIEEFAAMSRRNQDVKNIQTVSRFVNKNFNESEVKIVEYVWKKTISHPFNMSNILEETCSKFNVDREYIKSNFHKIKNVTYDEFVFESLMEINLNFIDKLKLANKERQIFQAHKNLVIELVKEWNTKFNKMPKNKSNIKTFLSSVGSDNESGYGSGMYPETINAVLRKYDSELKDGATLQDNVFVAMLADAINFQQQEYNKKVAKDNIEKQKKKPNLKNNTISDVVKTMTPDERMKFFQNDILPLFSDNEIGKIISMFGGKKR